MTKGMFMRVGDTLVPIGPPALEALHAIKDGDKCIADVHGARNIAQLNLFWALVTLVAEQEDEDKENVKKWLMFKLGYVDHWFEPDGRMHLEAGSIAIESMDQAAFNRLFNASVKVIAERLGSAPKEVLSRFNELVDPSQRMPKRLRPSRRGKNDDPGPGTPAGTENAQVASTDTQDVGSVCLNRIGTN